MAKTSGWALWDNDELREWAKERKAPHTFRKFIEERGITGDALPNLNLRELDGVARLQYSEVDKIRNVLKLLDIPENAPCFDLTTQTKGDTNVKLVPAPPPPRSGGTQQPSSSGVLMICPRSLADELIHHFHEVSTENRECFGYVALPCSMCICRETWPPPLDGSNGGDAASLCPQGCAACVALNILAWKEAWRPQVNYLKGSLDILRLPKNSKDGCLLSANGDVIKKPIALSEFPSEYVVIASANLPSEKSTDYADLNVGLTAIGKWDVSDGHTPGIQNAAFRTAVRECKEKLCVDIASILEHQTQAVMRESMGVDRLPYVWKSNHTKGFKVCDITGHIFFVLCDSSIELLSDGVGMARLIVADGFKTPDTRPRTPDGFRTPDG